MSFFSLFKAKSSCSFLLLALIFISSVNAFQNNQYSLDLTKEEKETLEKAIEAGTIILIVCIVVGAVIFIAFCLCFACLIYKRRQQHQRFNDEIELNRRNNNQYQQNSPPQYYTPQYPVNPGQYPPQYPQQYN
jgi:hypothetical protein